LILQGLHHIATLVTTWKIPLSSRLNIFVALAIVSVALADSKTSTTKPATKSEGAQDEPRADNPDTKARAARLDEMRVLAAKLSFDEPGAKPALRHLVMEEPLLHYSDADRGLFDGTLWAYGREGRPVAFVEMYCGREINPRYRHATTGTCDRPLKLIGAPGIAWTPQGSAITWATLKSDKSPAAELTARLRQLRELAQRFTAYQIFEPTMQREELRLLSQPLYRYSDDKLKIRDGAVFAMALGTNPEALLFIEARDDGKGAAAWHYGWARRGTSGSIHGFLDGEEVWSVKRLLQVTPEDPHVHFYRSLNGNPLLDAPS
jgi:hypothetical protein